MALMIGALAIRARLCGMLESTPPRRSRARGYIQLADPNLRRDKAIHQSGDRRDSSIAPRHDAPFGNSVDLDSQ